MSRLSIPIDKQAHALSGYALALSVAVVVGVPWVGFAVAAVAGWVKELYDRLSGRGTPDVWDAMATICGGFAAEVFYKFFVIGLV